MNCPVFYAGDAICGNFLKRKFPHLQRIYKKELKNSRYGYIKTVFRKFFGLDPLSNASPINRDLFNTKVFLTKRLQKTISQFFLPSCVFSLFMVKYKQKCFGVLK